MRVNGNQTLVPQQEEDIKAIKWVAQNDIETYLQQTYKNIVDIINRYYSSLHE